MQGNKKAYLNSPFKKGVSANPGGSRKGQRADANDFKEWAFKFWKENKKQFEDVILNNETTAMKYLQLLAGFVPQETKLTGDKENPVSVQIINYVKDNTAV